MKMEMKQEVNFAKTNMFDFNGKLLEKLFDGSLLIQLAFLQTNLPAVFFPSEQ